MFDIVLNATLGIYGIIVLRITFVENFYMFTMLIQELCHNFSGIFQNSFSKLWATSFDFTRNYCYVLLSLFNSLRKYVYMISLLMFFKTISIKNSNFKTMLCHEINLTNIWDHFLKDVSI